MSTTLFTIRNQEEVTLTREILEIYNENPYTTCRICHRTKYFQFEFNMTRLFNSNNEMFLRGVPNLVHLDSLEDFKRVMKKEYQTISKRLSVYEEEDFFVTTILSKSPCDNLVVISSVRTTPRHPPNITVLLHHGLRENPQVKTTKWCIERKALEEQKLRVDANEVILINDEEEITEGITSNVFVVFKNGSLHTAMSSKVLNGTVREGILSMLREENAHVEDQAPLYVSSMNQWREAFITSTSRFIVPISKLIFNGKEYNMEVGPGTFTAVLKEKFLRRAESQCVDVFDEDA